MSLFAARDSLTILGSFNLPPLVAPELSTALSLTHGTALVLAQLLVPLAMQIISTPLHLLGCDLYNAPSREASARRAFILKKYSATLAARWARILPAFGICGVLNRRLRSALNTALEG